MNRNNKKLVVESKFIKQASLKDLTLDEFLLLLYFDNAYESVFNLELIKDVLKLSEEKILEAYTNLLTKKIINVQAVKNADGKIIEKVSLDDFYQDIALEDRKQEKEEVTKDIFSEFESEMGRTLSPSDYELINAWIENGFTEELIIAALKEAAYNGALTLRYIDKVLYEWRKKGIKNASDVDAHLRNYEDDSPLYETKVLEFDWLADEK